MSGHCLGGGEVDNAVGSGHRGGRHGVLEHLFPGDGVADRTPFHQGRHGPLDHHALVGARSGVHEGGGLLVGGGVFGDGRSGVCQ